MEIASSITFFGGILLLLANAVLMAFGIRNQIGSQSGDLVHERHLSNAILAIGFVVFLAIQGYGWWVTNLPGRPGPSPVLFTTGALLFGLGAFIRLWSVTKLGNLFTYQIGIRAKSHTIVRSGPYRWVRHPGYAGFIVAEIGVNISNGFWLGLLIALVLLTAAFAIRIPEEEKMLRGHFGAEYERYCDETKRLFPFLF